MLLNSPSVSRVFCRINTNRYAQVTYRRSALSSAVRESGTGIRLSAGEKTAQMVELFFQLDRALDGLCDLFPQNTAKAPT